MMVSLADLRLNYTQGGLVETEVAEHPFTQFQLWLQQAITAQLPEPNAMTLATVTAEGKPMARMVLLKGLDEKGFVFFTNYHSQKSQHLKSFPWASLVFWWAALERQVRIEGAVEQIAATESDAYFQSRPRSSQIGAWASPQSQVITGRPVLTERWQEMEDQFGDRPIPRPPHWGGWRVLPEQMEFWQGRPSRLHDRILFTWAQESGWSRQRLAP